MSRSIYAFVFFFAGLSACKDGAKSSNEKITPPNGRNMFGLGIPRGLTKTSDGLADGYAMFSVTNSGSTYLINRKGEVVHEWKANYSVHVLSGYLIDDGSIVQSVDDPDFPVFGFGGPYGRIVKISWDGKTLWDFEYATEEYIIHHDFAVLPNGNILAIAYEVMTYEEAIKKGRKPELTPKDGPWLEKIIEIEPQGKHGGKIVWEWHLWDHLIQDYDPTKTNYGNPSEHPELLDFNMGEELPPYISQDSVEVLQAQGKGGKNTTAGNRGADIYHVNAINYHPALDQIVISSPTLNEIFVIDHSTTIKEAASHKGGQYGKGGDFLYRWGNPKNYHRGDSTLQQLFDQHDVRWVEEGKPGAGNLTIFNNNVRGTTDSTEFSAIYEIVPPINQNGNYVLEKGKSYGPENPVWKYVAPDSLSFYSGFISGAHRMSNGNTFINEGARGRIFEVTPDGKIVWEFLNHFRGEIRKLNGDPHQAAPMMHSLFRSTFIPADHPALVGKELKPMDPQPEPFVPPPPPDKKM